MSLRMHQHYVYNFDQEAASFNKRKKLCRDQCEISTNLYTHVQSVHTWKTEKEGGRGSYVHSFGHLPILVSY